MDLRGFLNILRKRWLIIVFCLGVSVGIAAAITVTATPVYQTSTQIYVHSEASGDITSAFTGDLLALQRVKSYASLATTGPVLGEAFSRAHVPPSNHPAVAAFPVDPEEVILAVAVSDRDPRVAYAVAVAIGQVLPEHVADVEHSAAGASSVRLTVVDPPGIPRHPVTPKPKRNIILGVLVGLIVGGGAAFLAESLDTTLRVAEDLDRPDTPGIFLGTLLYNREGARKPLPTASDPRSSNAEAFRHLRTALQFVRLDEPLRSIVVSSPISGDGKSTVACNLAIAFAQAGQRVILVDADLRRPSVDTYMEVPGGAGLTNALLGQVPVDHVLQDWGGGLLKVLTSGPLPPNPSEILGSQAMADMVHQLESRADIVIFDCSPLLPVTDAAVLTAHCTGALVVARSGRTKRQQLARALAVLSGVGDHLLGVTLNFVPDSALVGYGYSYGDAYGAQVQAASGRAGRRGKKQRQPAAGVLPPSSSSANGSSTTQAVRTRTVVPGGDEPDER